ncbi:glycosyltransferase family 9 protein [Celerinatantimonas diazotrophica]|nr:glycosyltransferase family 9 protein [Celerinatantimonas diazotrophica]
MQPLIGLLLQLIKKRNTQTQLLDKEQIKSIAIIRSNRRIGNTVFLLPFVNQIKTTFPNAQITLILKEPWQRQIFAHLGIHQFRFSQFRLKNLRLCFQSLWALRKDSYDLALVPCGSSQDSIICALLNAKNKIAYENARYREAYTHTVPSQNTFGHAALQCLNLIPQLYEFAAPIGNYQMTLSDSEKAKGLSSRRAYNVDTKQLCIAFFRGARGQKQLTDDTWRKILDQFTQASTLPIQWIEVMAPDMSEPLFNDSSIYRAKGLRELAGFLKYNDAFISCDTGPLHLADAVDSRCIGLYTHTNPVVYGLLNEKSIYIRNITDFNAAAILQKVMSERPALNSSVALLTHHSTESQSETELPLSLETAQPL